MIARDGVNEMANSTVQQPSRKSNTSVVQIGNQAFRKSSIDLVYDLAWVLGNDRTSSSHGLSRLKKIHLMKLKADSN
uniref:Uncharacterized protein n=1 Tax=Acrobeloides nanus TaxID=290746 RepID=A0A914CD61_9BILA